MPKDNEKSAPVQPHGTEGKKAEITIKIHNDKPFTLDTLDGEVTLQGDYNFRVNPLLQPHSAEGKPADVKVGIDVLDPITGKKIYGYTVNTHGSQIDFVDFVHNAGYKTDKTTGQKIGLAPSGISEEATQLLREQLTKAFANESFSPKEAREFGRLVSDVGNAIIGSGLEANMATIRKAAKKCDAIPSNER